MSGIKLYQSVAIKIINLIDQGILRNGDKLPSIRNISKDLGVSINTIKEAYLHLENNNYIESKPQSGFYVNYIDEEFKENYQDPATLDPLKVSLCRIYSSLLKHGDCPPKAELAISSVDRSLWPLNKIASCFSEAFKNHGNEALNYCIPPGYLPLREQIAIHSIRGGVKVNPDEIIITSGCTDGITLALMSICKPGDTIAFETPIYFNFIQACKEMDLNVIEIPNSRDKGLSIETLKFVLEYHNLKAFVSIPNFNNPLGGMMPDEQKKELVELLDEYNVPLIEDDIYSELYFTKSRPTTCKSFDKTGNVILCSSFSKTLAPGVRVGWMIPGKYFEKVENKKILYNLGTSAIPQIALSYYLKEGGYERHLKKLRITLSKQIEEICSYILKVFPEGTRVVTPLGGLVIWIECPKGSDALELYNKVKEKGILFAPGPIFSLNDNYRNCLRINGGTWNSEVKDAIDEMAKYLK